MPTDVLLLGPSRVAREDMERVLAKLDFEPIPSDNLAEALRAVEGAAVAVIIADIGVLIGGKQLSLAAKTVGSTLRKAVEELRAGWLLHAPAEERQRSIPIILTASANYPDAHAAALTAGADLFLSEPEAARYDILGVHLERLLAPATDIQTADTRGASATLERPRIAEIFELADARLRADSGRWDAVAIAKLLDVPLRRFVQVLGGGYSTIAKTPDSEALQPRLAPFANVLSMLLDVYAGNEGDVRRWLRAPHKLLGGTAPLDVLLTSGGVDGVEQLVTGAWLGEPA